MVQMLKLIRNVCLFRRYSITLQQLTNSEFATQRISQSYDSQRCHSTTSFNTHHQIHQLIKKYQI